jgi:hypothetical protein
MKQMAKLLNQHERGNYRWMNKRKGLNQANSHIKKHTHEFYLILKLGYSLKA